MKRIISVFLVCILLVGIGQVAFAQNGFNINAFSPSAVAEMGRTQYTNVYTTTGTAVPAYIRGELLSTQDIAEIRSYVQTNYSGVTEDAAPTTNYNCHSYAWHKQHSNNTYWINDPTNYITDPHCTEIATPTAGCIVVYNSSDPYYPYAHSGVVISVDGDDIIVRSKWGPWGLYTHDLEEVPVDYTYDGTNIDVDYYTYTREHSCRLYTFNDYEHSGTCLICRVNFSEAHTPNALGTKCTKCPYTGPFAARSLECEEDGHTH